MYGMDVPMSPDDHYADLKRVIAAIGGKARRITVIMPMLYEGRQHKRNTRESLDCALALQELTALGVDNIITFEKSYQIALGAGLTHDEAMKAIVDNPHELLRSKKILD